MIAEAQRRARADALDPAGVLPVVRAQLASLAGAAGTRPVLNATGVVVHTNLGRSPLSEAARAALVDAAGYTDVELDLSTGRRGRRGASLTDALLAAVPEAGGALVVNNGAAALLLATAALAAGREIVVSRGELVEIGDGFRLPALIESGGARLREVGTTNRTHLADYVDALDTDVNEVDSSGVGALLKVHPSNFRVDGFTAEAGVPELGRLARERRVPLVVDLGSGLLGPDAALPQEPDVRTALHEGAQIVTASADKLLGGPQAGLVLGDEELVERLRRHPMARALRVDKLTLAALEATVRDPAQAPVTQARQARPEELRRRCEGLAARLGSTVGEVEVVPSEGRVGGGGAPGVVLDGYAVALPEALAEPLRTGTPAVLGRVHGGRLLLDLRCVPAAEEAALELAVRRAASAVQPTDHR